MSSPSSRRGADHQAAAARRARAAALLLGLLLVAVLTPLVLAACGAQSDAFAGQYWEPTTGRRIEIRQDGDAYKLFYGRDERPFTAVRDGDQLVIRDPMGGRTLVRPGEAEGTLELVTGGKTTVLKPLPQHL